MEISSEAIYNVARDEKTYGPYKGHKLVEMALTGRLQRSDHLWTEGMNDWLHASEFGELSSLFKEVRETKAPPKQAEDATSAPPPESPTPEPEVQQNSEPAQQKPEPVQEKAKQPAATMGSAGKSRQSTVAIGAATTRKAKPKADTKFVVKELDELSQESFDFEEINFDALPLAKLKK